MVKISIIIMIINNLRIMIMIMVYLWLWLWLELRLGRIFIMALPFKGYILDGVWVKVRIRV